MPTAVKLNEKLIKACQLGSLALVKKLVEAGADIEFSTNDPFHIVCGDYKYTDVNLPIAKYLVEKGVDASSHNHYAFKVVIDIIYEIAEEEDSKLYFDTVFELLKLIVENTKPKLGFEDEVRRTIDSNLPLKVKNYLSDWISR